MNLLLLIYFSMKKKLIFPCIIIFIIYILLFPQISVEAAANGLILWYEKLLPSLLPFAILSNILIYSNYLAYLTKYLSKVTQLLFPSSTSGSFVIISGFLFGFPMGSKNCAELVKQRELSNSEANILFIITNNISPVFISSYILCQQLKMPSRILFSYLVLYLPPVVAGILLLRKNKTQTFSHKKTASGSQMNFKIIDAGIMNGFETLTRLGGYIMLFSMITSMVSLLPLPDITKALLAGILEITNGIRELTLSGIAPDYQYVLAMAFTAFGGISGFAQTSSMVKGTSLSMKWYVILKLLFTACSALLAWLVISLT